VNDKGNVMRAMIGGLMMIIGLVIMFSLWSPLVAILLPLLANSETIAMGAVIQAIVLLIPAIVVFVGVVILVSEAYGGDGGGQQIYR